MASILARICTAVAGAGSAGARSTGARSTGAVRDQPALADLVRMVLPQQHRNLLGLQQAGQAEEVLVLGRGAELPAVIEHPVEVRGGFQRLERRVVQGVGVITTLPR